MSVGVISQWSRGGVVGSIQVTDDSSPVGDILAFAFDNCTPRLKTLLMQTDVPPSTVNVRFSIVPFSGDFVATGVDGPI
jgi:hypothetical protein